MDLFWPYMVVLEGFRDGFALLILSVSVWGHWAKSHYGFLGHPLEN